VQPVKAKKKIPFGPGTELRRIIASWQKRFPWLSLSATPGCGCGSTARQMDAWGPSKCAAKIDVLVAKLEAEAAKRRLTVPFRKTAARLLIKQAIRRARRAQADRPPPLPVADHPPARPNTH
jgi:hypothetical protein